MTKYFVIIMTLLTIAANAAPKAQVTSKDARMPSQVTGDITKFAHTPGYNKTAPSYVTDFGSVAGASMGVRLSLHGEVAEDIFEKMNPRKVKTKVYDNTCTLKDGTNITVKVEQRTGKTFGCEKWPVECWGALMYKCESELDMEKGSAKAIQTNP
jgi:hypothetical protein